MRSIRVWITIFIVGLVLSGVTAFPLQSELSMLVRLSSLFHLDAHAPALNSWLGRVLAALSDTNVRYPFLAYGTDWLAFGHLVIAIAFIGPWIDPVRNKWFISFGLIACAGVIPLALIAGAIRGIPFYWRLIDCSFGVFGCVPLLIVHRKSTNSNTEHGARLSRRDPSGQLSCPLGALREQRPRLFGCFGKRGVVDRKKCQFEPV